MTAQHRRAPHSSRILSRLVTVLGAALFACAAVAAGESGSAQVETLLRQSLQASNIESALETIGRAEQMIRKAHGRAPEIILGFLEAEAIRMRGQAWLMAYERGGRTDEAARKQAVETLRKAVKAFAAFRDRCDKEAESIERQLTGEDPQENRGWVLAVSHRSRANYSSAWAGYNLGQALSDPREREAALRDAADRFAGFTSGGYRNHPIVADCFLGQALCLNELGEHFEAVQLLEPAAADNTAPTTYKRMQYLRVKANHARGSYLTAEREAKSYFDALPADKKLDTMELEMALTWIESLVTLVQVTEEERFQKMFQSRIDSVAETIYEYGEPWRGRVGKILARGKGGGPMANLIRARDLFAENEYAKVFDECTTGLKKAGANTDPDLLTQLHFTRAAAAWNMKDNVAAFTAGDALLRHAPKHPKALEMLTRAFAAGLEARRAEAEGLSKEKYIDFLAYALETFPGSPDAGEIRWEFFQAQLARRAWDTARKVLTGYGPDHPLRLRGLYGRALLGHRQILVARDAEPPDLTKIEAGLADVTAGLTAFAAQAPAEWTPAQRDLGLAAKDIAFAGARELLDLPDPKGQAAVDLLDIAAKLPEEAPGEPDTRAMGLRIEAYMLTDRVPEALALVRDAVDQGLGDAHLAAAYSAVADRLQDEVDAAIEAGKTDEARGLSERLVRIYTQLLAHAGDTAPRQIVALRRRLANNLQFLGRYKEAVPHYVYVEDRVPKEEAGDILRGLALSLEATGSFEAALARWRTLSRGVEKQTAPWYEARYHLILCAFRSGEVRHAKKLVALERLQNPDIQVGDWEERFAALQQEIDAAAAKAAAEEPTPDNQGNDEAPTPES